MFRDQQTMERRDNAIFARFNELLPTGQIYFQPDIYCTACWAKASKNLDEAADGKGRFEDGSYEFL